MSEQDQQKLNSKAVPFFARYLEGQLEDLSQEEMKAVSGGRGFLTKKYPSDHEDCGGMTLPMKDDVAVTLKYPSDNEDGGIPIKPDPGVTEKYPSDSDEWAVTQKYPSDGDDDVVPIDVIS
jgi:hypothetical protein